MGGGVRDKVELASKFGINLENGKREVRGDPEYVRAACEASLKRLNVDCIDLYYQHRVDTRVPIEITVSFLFQYYYECHCITTGSLLVRVSLRHYLYSFSVTVSLHVSLLVRVSLHHYLYHFYFIISI